MIEDKVKDFLESKLSVPVLMERPNDSSVSGFVIIEKTGGGQENHIPSAMLTIQSYENSMQKAAELNEEVKHWMLDGMEGLITLNEVAQVQLNSDYNYTDTTTKEYRYQAVYDIIHY